MEWTSDEDKKKAKVIMVPINTQFLPAPVESTAERYTRYWKETVQVMSMLSQCMSIPCLYTKPVFTLVLPGTENTCSIDGLCQTSDDETQTVRVYYNMSNLCK